MTQGSRAAGTQGSAAAQESGQFLSQVEQGLEPLMRLAHAHGEELLAYLLHMALLEARDIAERHSRNDSERLSA